MEYQTIQDVNEEVVRCMLSWAADSSGRSLSLEILIDRARQCVEPRYLMHGVAPVPAMARRPFAR